MGQSGGARKKARPSPTVSMVKEKLEVKSVTVPDLES
ncbi:hypothetical protein TIFTF001_040615 [Ficus carica]|uniref:Uncharacterized protein n=1 Tax=Ficus carica TaxID=3494 RepID=A0AA87Z3U5_FICCA|nr:hypothetical protein TIFTF001_040606 [Ficus carica]GMN24742.1 hypothetical protein TIFTF001_040615 [Ficus carica]